MLFAFGFCIATEDGRGEDSGKKVLRAGEKFGDFGDNLVIAEVFVSVIFEVGLDATLGILDKTYKVATGTRFLGNGREFLCEFFRSLWGEFDK